MFSVRHVRTSEEKNYVYNIIYDYILLLYILYNIYLFYFLKCRYSLVVSTGKIVRTTDYDIQFKYISTIVILMLQSRISNTAFNSHSC